MAQEAGSEPLAIERGKNLNKWLAGKPGNWAQAIAVRAALRVLPLALVVSADTRSRHLTQAAFRGNFISWAVCKYPGHDMTAAVIAAAHAAIDPATVDYATAHVTHAVRAAGSAAAAAAASSIYAINSATAAAVAEAAYAIDHAAADAAATRDLWAAIDVDADWLAGQDDRASLIDQPLWLIDVRGDSKYHANFPLWAREPFDAFVKSEITRISPWGLIVDWYRALLPDSRDRASRSLFGERIDTQIAFMSPAFWDRDPDEVIGDIAKSANWRPGRQPASASSVRKRPERKIAGENFERSAEFSASVDASAEVAVERSAGQATERPSSLTDAVATHSDEPTRDDRLGRRPFARALVERIGDVRRSGGKDGFAVHLHAPWGAGKTSVLYMMRDIMEDRKLDKHDRWATAMLEAWRHERREPPWWPLIQAVKHGCARTLLRNRYFLRWIALEAIWAWWWFWAHVVPIILALGALILGVALVMKFAGDVAVLDLVNSMTTIVGVLVSLLTAFGVFVLAGRTLIFGSSNSAKFYEDLTRDPMKNLTARFMRIVKTAGMPICIFIDDLDRCGADYVSTLLEGIQTAFRGRDVTYVVAADRAWIGEALAHRYGAFSHTVGSAAQPLGYLFLEKVFQISIAVPNMGSKTQSAYWTGLLKGQATSGSTAKEERRGFFARLLERLEDAESAATSEYEKALQELRLTVREARRKDGRKGKGLTREDADDLLRQDDSAQRRAAIALELNASRAADEEAEHMLARFSELLPGNPRAMKRMVNAFALRQTASILEDADVAPEILARWTILEQRYPVLAERLSERPEQATALAGAIEKMPEDLRPLVAHSAVRDIIRLDETCSLSEDDIRAITRGVRRTPAAAEAPK